MNLKLLIGITFLSISFILYIGGFLLLFITIISPFLILTLKARSSKSKNTLGFFHPYCNDGGGGERVLWCLIRCLQKKYGNKFEYAIYTGDNVTKEEILEKAKSRFNIELDGKNIKFINLKSRNFVEAKYYPYFTMLGQSLGSMIVGCEAIFRLNCFIMFDTMGYAFTYPIFKLLGGSKVFCYTHYPTISSDMLKRVVERRSLYNNNEKVSGSVTLSSVKINYYKLFAKIYGLFGSFSDLIFVNSTWTANHINEIWKCKAKTFTLFPPCDTTATQNFDFEPRDDIIISISQFRPEKDQKLQIKAYSLYKQKWLESSSRKSNLAKFYLIGSSRNDSDRKIISEAKQLCEELGVSENVEFVINADYKKLLNFFSKAKIGLHSMWNEHFGIGVVELLSSGTVTIAHNSGGPKEDIVTKYEGNDTGYLASTAQEYADFIFKVMENFDDHKLMRQSARSSVKRFSEQEFEKTFTELITKFI